MQQEQTIFWMDKSGQRKVVQAQEVVGTAAEVAFYP